MRCICLVQSPLQVINTLEAIDYFGISEALFVLIKWDKRPENYPQVLKQLPKGASYVTLYRDDSSAFSAVHYYAKELARLNAYNADLLLIGDVRPYAFTDLARSIDCPWRVLIDDGAGTILIYEHLVKTARFYDLPKSSSPERQAERDEQKRKHGIKTNASPPYDLFTSFDMESTSHSTVYRQKQLRFCHEHQKVNKRQALIVGTPLVERGKMLLDDYLLALRMMSKDCNLDYFYVPHRNEAPEKIADLLSAGIPLQVLEPNCPLEFWLKRNQYPPAHIYSTTSGVLWNIYKTQPKISVKAFLPTNEILRKGVKKDAWGIAGVNSHDALRLVADYYSRHLPHAWIGV